MSLSRVIMRLARNPGTEFAGGDDHRGYSLVAPLTADGRLDLEAWHAEKAHCAVRRFAPDEDPMIGHLVRRGQGWFFDYDGDARGDDESVRRLGDHTFGVGDYVTVSDHDGRALTYKVTEVAPA